MFRQYRPLEQGEFIVLGVDTAAGGTDYCAGQFLSKKHLDVPLVYHEKIVATAMTPQIHTKLEEIYLQTGVQPVVAYERNNGGVFEMERLAVLNRNGKYRVFEMPQYGSIDNPSPKKYGWDTNTATRPKMLSDLKEVIDKRIIKIYDRPTINEMFSFIVVPTSNSWKAQAEKSAHDDLIMSLAIAWQLYQSENPPRSLEDDYYEDNKFTKDGFYV